MPMFYFIGYIEYLHIIIQNIFFGGGGVYYFQTYVIYHCS